ncbi:MAG: response regulator transcription factor [Bacteroidales bacterium]|jgi:DNA-binding NarL/FixJ family response regulator|nr:response regulator transcription factor [Bacteroidales bacterium]MBR6278788.1 response regulator transcription factor [Bacteroidales bacterium]
MRHNRDIIRISVLEPSKILHAGVISVIKETVDCEVVFQEFLHENFAANLEEFSPDVIIINPYYSEYYNFKLLKSSLEKKIMKPVHFVSLNTGIVPETVLGCFESVISLYDEPKDIHLMLDKLMGYDKHYGSSDELTEREKEIIRYVVRGKSNKEISADMNISVYTVSTHRRNISKKLQIHSATAMTIYAISNNLVSINEVKSL